MDIELEIEAKKEESDLDLEDVLTACEECSTKDFLFESTGEVVCISCGVVLDDNSVISIEPRAFTRQEKLDREQNSPIFNTNFGLSTFPRNPKDIHGRHLSQDKRQRFYRMRQQERYAVNKSLNRCLSIAVPFVDRLCTELGLTENQIREETMRLFRKAHKEGYILKGTIEGTASACLYIVCRNLGVHRSIKEIAKITSKTMDITTKNIARIYRGLYWLFDGEVKQKSIEPIIARALSEMENEGYYTPQQRTTVEKNAFTIYKKMSESLIFQGKAPTSITGSIIYYVTQELDWKISQKEIAKIVGTTDVSIRNRLSDIEKIIPDFNKIKAE
jgi:transcription initiation factor TFIIB